MAQLSAKYRPREWSDVVGQEVAVTAIRESLKQGWGGRAWWIVGGSGTGCTTIAMLIAGEQADESRFRLVGGDAVDVAMVRRMADENPGKETVIANRAYIIEWTLAILSITEHRETVIPSEFHATQPFSSELR